MYIHVHVSVFLNVYTEIVYFKIYNFSMIIFKYHLLSYDDGDLK